MTKVLDIEGLRKYHIDLAFSEKDSIVEESMERIRAQVEADVVRQLEETANKNFEKDVEKFNAFVKDVAETVEEQGVDEVAAENESDTVEVA